jgi:hypothetical protein
LLGSKAGVNDNKVFSRLTYHIIFKPGENELGLIRELHALGVKEITVQMAKSL